MKGVADAVGVSVARVYKIAEVRKITIKAEQLFPSRYSSQVFDGRAPAARRQTLREQAGLTQDELAEKAGVVLRMGGLCGL